MRPPMCMIIVVLVNSTASGSWHSATTPRWNTYQGRSRPNCSMSSMNYCVADNNTYDYDDVNEVIKLNYDILKLYNDSNNYPNAEENESKPNFEYTPICKSGPLRVRLTWGRTVHGEWVKVLNSKEYFQFITLVICSNPGTACKQGKTGNGIRLVCVQRYRAMLLAALHPRRREPSWEQFLLPSSCSCVITHKRMKEASSTHSHTSC